jgi:arginase family enzyme
MDCSQTQRRPGSETGPSQFCKLLKFSPLKAIGDVHSTYLNCFSYIGTDMHLFKLSSFVSKLTALHEHIQESDTAICIGGDSSILPVMTEVDPDFDVIIKISPCISRGPLGEGGKKDHSSYVTSMSDTLRAKIVHFGLLDYTNSQTEVRIVQEEDKAKVVFLDKFGKTNVEAFSKLLNSFNPKTKLGVMIDCESLTPDYFPGVTFDFWS